MLSVDVPILEKTNTVLIEIPYGFEEEIQFNITDKTLTESTAVLYIEQPTGLPVSVPCSVSGNKVSYAPNPHDFFPGNNICQIRVGESLSMNIVVRCYRGAYIPTIDVLDNDFTEKLLKRFENVMSGLTEDSEVIDIRLGEDGETYSTAGEAVRTQFANAKAYTKNQEDEIKDARTDCFGETYDTLGEAIRTQEDELHRTKSSGISLTESGETIEIAGSEEKLFRNIKIYGKATQEKINGYQLFDASKISSTSINSISVTNKDDGSFSISSNSGEISNKFAVLHTIDGRENVTALFKKGIVHSSVSDIVPKFYVQFFRKSVSSSVPVCTTKENGQVDITEHYDNIDLVKIGFFAESGETFKGGTIKPMVWQDGDGTWEPFTNHKPAPNPDYEIPIIPTGNYNDETQKYEVPINVTGNQLFDASKLPTTSQGGATVTNNSDGSFTIGGNGTLSVAFGQSHIYTHEETINILRVGKIKLESNGTTYPTVEVGLIESNKVVWANYFTPDSETVISSDDLSPSNGYRLMIRIFGNTGQSIIPGTIKPMLYQSGDGTWEPFKTPQQAVPAFDEPLYGIPVESGGNYTDASGKQWISDVVDLEAKTLTRYCGINVLDGSSDESWNLYSADKCIFYISLTKAVAKNSRDNGLCNLIPPVYDVTQNYQDYGITFGISNQYIYLCLYPAGINSTALLRQWLQSNPITVVYPLATPTTTPLTPDQISALQKLQSYYPNTNVFTNTNPQAGLETEHNADIKMYVDSVVSKAVTQAITIAQGGQL